jgi:hypothetical protein
MEWSKTFAIAFNIFRDARYHHIKVVRNETSFRASTTGLGKSIEKFNLLFVEKEQRMLAQTTYKPTSPYNLSLKFGYFNMEILFINKFFKFHNVDFGEFNLVSMPTIIAFRFYQSVCKK